MTYDYRAARAAIFGSKLPGALKLTALVLIEYMPNCEPSVSSIAAASGVERKTAIRAIANLERLGVISVQRRSGARSGYQLQPETTWRHEWIEPVPHIGTSTKTVPVPNEHGTGTNGGMGPVPNTPKTGTKLVPEAEEADQKAGEKAVRTQASPTMGPVPGTGSGTAEDAPRPFVHSGPLQPSRRDRETAQEATGGRPAGKFEFDPAWRPKPKHRARGVELGLTDQEILARAEDCLLKLYTHPFPNEDKQFMRELGWAARDKETAKFKRDSLANRRDNEMPGHDRRPT